MRSKKFLPVAFLLTVLFLIFAEQVYAAASTTPGANAPISYVEDFASKYLSSILGIARTLFGGLATVSLILGLMRMLLDGEINIGTLVSHLTKWILYVGIFMYIMSTGNADTFIPRMMVNSFVQIGSRVGGVGSVAPDNILAAGIKLYGNLLEKGWEAGWGDFIGVTLIGVIVLVVVAMIAGTIALALIEMHLVICGGAILLGFGGFEYTREIAMSYLKYSISVGIKLLMIMVIYKIADTLSSAWATSMGSLTSMPELLTMSGQVLGGVITLYMVVKYIPNIAQGIVNNALMTFGSPQARFGYLGYVESRANIINSNGAMIRAIIDSFRGRGGGGSVSTVSGQDGSEMYSPRPARAGYIPPAGNAMNPGISPGARSVEAYTQRDSGLNGGYNAPADPGQVTRIPQNQNNVAGIANYVSAGTIFNSPIAPGGYVGPSGPVFSGQGQTRRGAPNIEEIINAAKEADKQSDNDTPKTHVINRR